MIQSSKESQATPTGHGYLPLRCSGMACFLGPRAVGIQGFGSWLQGL